MIVDPKSAVYGVSGAMLVEFDLTPARAPPYRCQEPDAAAIPLSELRWPHNRALDPARLRRILGAIASRTPLPAVPVYREPNAATAVVLDGAHRLAIALALGYSSVPCKLLSLQESKDGYRYPEGQR